MSNERLHVVVRRRWTVALVGLVAVLAGCSGGEVLSRETASQEGWIWGLTVERGQITCERGISDLMIGFRPDGSSFMYALSSNAVGDALGKRGSRYTAAQLGDIWDGKAPFRPFLDAAWRACGREDGAPDHDAQVVMGNAYQDRQ